MPSLASSTSALGLLRRSPAPQPENIVDRLIIERAPRLVSRELGRLALRHTLYPLLGYEQAVALASRIQPMSGHEIFAYIRQVLRQRLVVSGLEHVPPHGRLIVIANHPTGLADGIAVFAALRRVRPDIWFLANSDALRVARGLAEIVVPVEWEPAKRSHSRMREMLTRARQVMARDQALVIFPSGRLAHLTWRGLAERPWQPTVVSLARRFEAPILPMRIVARNSALFYAFSQIGTELRDITLFHELLNKRGRLFEIQIAPPIPIDRLAGEPGHVAARLQRYVEGGLRGRDHAAMRASPMEEASPAARPR